MYKTSEYRAGVDTADIFFRINVSFNCYVCMFTYDFFSNN
jgi:hypothetical protein